ncbi:carbohydrate ABC transporter permease [Allokutzneria sp. NRRL B-24872]|uniref:carbohydrate ABC transporter permease n=1 Tax=Allokutzneria sp. NRRL B-24872 TaxID=1137961 RepID=UPI000A391930|nr:carbohydrate ABC transporter permease [Allokutzneria sp. NRRL B-24872]
MTTTLAPRKAKQRKGSWDRKLQWIATHSIGIALAIGFTMPIVFVFLTAVMSDQQALSSTLWPQEWHFENFLKVFEKAPMLQYMGNTLLYSLLATLGVMLSAIPTAYALARMKWRGRNVVFLLVVAAMMLPPQVVSVPLYDMWISFGLTGTLWPLVIPYFLFDAFSVFLLRQFFLTIPQDYIDAAKIDGCSEFTALVRVLVPMAKPGIAATALFCFLFTWNDYFGPLLYSGENQENWTLSLALASFRGSHQVQWNLTMAATVLIMAPAIVLFLLAQKSFVKGITFTGVKG